ncbi:MAG TPA: AAA family ATPase [Actinomycetota bacterium]
MLAGRNGLSPVMVGRASELARLRRLLAARSVPDARVALISGEAGIGKTRLLKELIAGLDPDPDALVLGGQAGQGMPGRPFQLLREAVASEVRDWEAVPARLADRDDALRMMLYPIAPRLACDRERDREYGQEELLGTAVDLIRELAPTLLVFEDLHWADAQSVALFGRLALTADLDVLLIGTFRPEGVDRRHPMLELLAELDRQRPVTSILLERLDQAQVHELVEAVHGGPVPFRVAETLHRRTGGNPFFLEELLATAAKDLKGSDATAAPERLASLPLPWNLTEAVLRRLDDLEPPERQVAETAAILGERIPFDLLASVAGRSEQELIEALRRLVREDLLAEREQDVFHFRHALTREAIAGQLLGRERRRLHEKALAALQEAGSDDWSAIVWHAQGAGRGEELVAAARAGAEAYVCRGASVDALRLAEHGLAEAPDDPALLAWASKAAWLIGLLDVSVEHGERRLEVARQRGDLEDQAAVLIHLARVHWEAHHPDRQWECVWQALEAARRLGPSPLLARAQARVSEAYMLADDATAAIEWADHTIALAERVGPRSVLLAAQVNKGTAMVEPNGPPSRRRREEGLALLERAVAEAEAADFDLTLHRALWNLMVNQVQSWPLERSWQVYRQLRAASERAGHAADNVGLAIRRSEIHVMEGDRHAALTAIAKGRRLTRTRNPSSVFEFLLDPYEAVLRIEGGELPAAEELLGRSREMMLTASQECDRVWFWAICASLAARRGDLDAARAACAQADAQVAAWWWGLGPEPNIGLIDAVAPVCQRRRCGRCSPEPTS